MVVSWEQETGVLMASGDVRHIRVWDTQREMKLQVCKLSFEISFFLLHIEQMLWFEKRQYCGFAATKLAAMHSPVMARKIFLTGNRYL